VRISSNFLFAVSALFNLLNASGSFILFFSSFFAVMISCSIAVIDLLSFHQAIEVID